jgi:hypothetical protein
VRHLKIEDFENARLADGTDQSCIFVDYPKWKTKTHIFWSFLIGAQV